MHRAQRVGGMWPKKHFAKRVPEIRPFRNMNGQRGKGIGDPVFRGLRERIAVRGHQREDPQNGACVVELRARNYVDAALVEQKIGAGNRRSAPPELPVEADRRGQMLHQQRRSTINNARVAIVGSHPVTRIRRPAGLKADAACSGFVLRLPVERVVVAAMAKMQKAASSSQKIESSLCVAPRRLENAAALAWPLPGFFQVKE